MELEHSFTVPVPEERAWEVLLDVERVAPCMPGATLDSVDGDVISGRIKVKVGPIAMTYAGTARFTERDPDAHVITLEAAGKETRGAGTASATVRSKLDGQGDQTHVTVNTTLNVTGRPAQFGRGVMAEVGSRLIGIFAANLADMLTAEQEPQAGTAAAVSAATGPAGAASDQLTADRAMPVEELQLSLRSYNSLRKDGIHTVGELLSRTSDDLLAIDNIGPASVAEIQQKLADRGLSLSESAAGPEGPLLGGSRPRAEEVPPAATRASANGMPSDAAAAASASVPPAQPRLDARPPEEDAIDLLSVAGLPVLKRALPAAAALLLVLLIALGLRRRKRSAAR